MVGDMGGSYASNNTSRQRPMSPDAQRTITRAQLSWAKREEAALLAHKAALAQQMEEVRQQEAELESARAAIHQTREVVEQREDEARALEQKECEKHQSKYRAYSAMRKARAAERSKAKTRDETETAEKRRDEEARNWASCVDYAPDAAARRALENVARAAAAAIGPKYAADVAPAALLAVQPNVHAGSRHLPPHLDWPRNDGFGVVIVTAAVRGGATVVLRDGGSAAAAPREWRFEVPEGHASALSGDARNLCTHGLFTDACDRESLNLRFNLHTHKRACDEIYAHWCEGPDAACGPKGPRYL